MSMPPPDEPEIFDPIAYGEKAAADYSKTRPLYEEFSATLRSLLEHALESSNIEVYRVDARAKAIDSFALKAGIAHPLERTRPKYRDPLKEITDMAGVRVITFMTGAVKQVQDVVRAQFVVIEEEDKFERLTREARFGYTSVHYVVKLRDDRTQLTEYRRFTGLFGEIQVRTVLQHAWAAIEHDLEYKAVGAVDPWVRRRFMAVAGMLEIADLHFQEIQTAVRQRLATDSVQKDDFVMAELTAKSLRSYLERRLGGDRRVGKPDYAAWVRVLRELGFTSVQQVDDCIANLDGDAISRQIWGTRQGQLQRFEGLLLAGMGDYYIDHHPSRELDHFVGLRRRWLDRLKTRGASVRSYRPR
jgi:ppGpp synthetase/RelA/SpoT-type nucleotidyltranferase